MKTNPVFLPFCYALCMARGYLIRFDNAIVESLRIEWLAQIYSLPIAFAPLAFAKAEQSRMQ